MVCYPCLTQAANGKHIYSNYYVNTNFTSTRLKEQIVLLEGSFNIDIETKFRIYKLMYNTNNNKYLFCHQQILRHYTTQQA